ncbi:gag/pol protein [Cucumis melo var. makuwa]|uniref:Gag/pol protein n=1 Tax=Cucumis melo var. makuwa TaxID=1194695 RepID=A0A5D3E4C4_CUCMM|nr:gag/pol protein [Cucumis melo var. makuwa]
MLTDVIGNDVGYLTDVKAWLAAQFQMKDLGEAQYNSKKGLLPFRHGVHLYKEQCPKTPQEVEDMRRIPYASAVGSLMYVILCTRPDICYAVGIVSRHQSNPGLDHWTTIKIILKYLRKTRDYMLVYGAKDLILTGYADSDFQIDKDSKKSTSRSVFTLNGGAVPQTRETHKEEVSPVREIVQRGNVIVTKIASEHNIADLFTKTLTTKVFEGHLESLGYEICTLGKSGQIADSICLSFWDKTKWGVGNIITQDGIHSFPPLGQVDKCFLK